MLKPMDRWNELTKGEAHDREINKDQKADWPRHLLELFMLTTIQDWPSLDTASITWSLGVDYTYPSTFIFPWQGAQRTPVC